MRRKLRSGKNSPSPAKGACVPRWRRNRASRTILPQDKVNEIRAKVIQGYWNLSLAYADYDITQKDKEIWEQVVQVAETRYSVGQGMQADVLQAQVELGSYLDRLFHGSSARNPCAPI